MKLGFALSPGGLLLPYHLGVLECLQHERVITPSSSTAMAGSSAGAIATMAYGCGLDPRKVLEATVTVSDQAKALGGARGRLLPLLREQMDLLIGDKEFEQLSENNIGIAYREIFPRPSNILQYQFESRYDLFQSVSASCMFPFFATNWPFLWDRSKGSLRNSRLLMDGFFSVPRERFGCPDFEVAVTTGPSSLGGNPNVVDDEERADTATALNDDDASEHPMRVDRTIGISVFPAQAIGMTAFDEHDIICPGQELGLEDLVRIATQSSSREDLTKVHDIGYENAERWCRVEEDRIKFDDQIQREEARKEWN